ncbi:probable serine carboxypeptidase CPVL [Coccomyxa sp. Obi]|nr:probable serine carboxypeptidase CPVL [Coccomyxa sp. Obi]
MLQNGSAHVGLASLVCIILVLGIVQSDAVRFASNPDQTVDLPNVTYSGYLPISDDGKDALFYAYYEALEPAKTDDLPILLWLEGGPGCASMLGNYYILGPYWPNRTLNLEPNPGGTSSLIVPFNDPCYKPLSLAWSFCLTHNAGTWNRKFGLLFIDQPLGTGFSIAGKRGIPTDEMEVATDLYIGLQIFFANFEQLQTRPLIITGESYAGKYVPSIGHFVLQIEEQLGQDRRRALLSQRRLLPQRALEMGPPLFDLAGLAVGNGLTDPRTQVLQHADVAFFFGMIDMQQRIEAMTMQLHISQLIADESWDEAHQHREALLEYITQCSGAGTLLDYRRYRDYDADKNVDRYLNQPEVKEALGVPKHIVYESCSDKVGDALGPDVMKSVKHLIPDILAALPMLLYQGQADAQDGPASNEPWIYSLDWHGRSEFNAAPRALWHLDYADNDASAAQGVTIGGHHGRVVGYWREHSTLAHVVIRNAGHMVPHDQPLVAQAMIEQWVDKAVGFSIADVNRGASLF